MSMYIDFHTIAYEILADNPTENLYFLLDHSGLPELHLQLLKSSMIWACLFDRTPEANALAAAPILIKAGHQGNLKMSRCFCEWLGESGTYASAVTIISSPLKFEPLMKRLVARLDVMLSEDLNAMLRFFDPRIIESMTRILDAEQLNYFFSPAESWRYVDRTGKLRCVKSNFNADENFYSSLILSQQQESELLGASEVDQVLDLLQSNLPTALESLPLETRYRFACEKVESARKIGLNSVLKFAIYIAVPLVEGEKFVEGPSWQNFLINLKQDDFSASASILSIN